jgi:hypothetical protein
MSKSARPFGKSKLVGGKGNFLMACSRGEQGPMHVGICSIYIYVHDNMYIYKYIDTYIYLVNLDDEYTLICSPSQVELSCFTQSTKIFAGRDPLMSSSSSVYKRAFNMC